MDQARLMKTLQLLSELNAERESLGALDLESKRNTDNIDVFEGMIRESHEGVKTVVAGHHIMFMREGQPLPGEISSADTLIFDHVVAQRVWGEGYKEVLTKLALEPIATRDALLRELYCGRV